MLPQASRPGQLAPLDRVHGELEDAVALIVGPERRARDPDDESHDVVDADVVASDSRLLRGVDAITALTPEEI